MKKTICVFLFLLIVLEYNCFAQWVNQQSNTSRHLFGLDMIDINTGYISGQLGTLRKTTNGGINWLTLSSPIGNDFGNVSFINVNTGLFVGPPSQLLYTSTGGASFNVRNQPTSGLAAVHFVSANTAYAVGDAIIKSIDGGLSWSMIRSGTLSQYQGVYFLDDNTGTVVGRPGLILTTTNGGTSWLQRTMYLPVQFGDSTLMDVKYVNPSVGFACSNNGIFMKTINGGANWTYYSTVSTHALYGISFLDINTGYATGNTGRIIKTTDGGVTWTQQISPTTDPLDYIEFVDLNNGWIAGFNGNILHTSNGGVTFVNPISNEIPESFSLSQNYPNPFNPSTRIKFDLPIAAEVNVKVFDMLGREIETLVSENLRAGIYEVEWNAGKYSSGIYYYKIVAGTYSETRKMILVK